jgi:hypothetical protein
MKPLTTAQRERLKSVVRELGLLQLDGASTLDGLLAELRPLLGAALFGIPARPRRCRQPRRARRGGSALTT